MICSIERSQPVNIAAVSIYYIRKRQNAHIGVTASTWWKMCTLALQNWHWMKLLSPAGTFFPLITVGGSQSIYTHVSASHATPFISIIRCSQLRRNETRNMIHSITLRALWNTLDSLLQLLLVAQAKIHVAWWAFEASLNLCNTCWNRFILQIPAIVAVFFSIFSNFSFVHSALLQQPPLLHLQVLVTSFADVHATSYVVQSINIHKKLLISLHKAGCQLSKTCFISHGAKYQLNPKLVFKVSILDLFSDLGVSSSRVSVVLFPGCRQASVSKWVFPTIFHLISRSTNISLPSLTYLTHQDANKWPAIPSVSKCSPRQDQEFVFFRSWIDITQSFSISVKTIRLKASC